MKNATMEKLEELIEHIREFHNELGADLETGSHHRNNQASEEFNRNHPYLMKWVTELFKKTDELDQHYHDTSCK